MLALRVHVGAGYCVYCGQSGFKGCHGILYHSLHSQSCPNSARCCNFVRMDREVKLVFSIECWVLQVWIFRPGKAR